MKTPALWVSAFLDLCILCIGHILDKDYQKAGNSKEAVPLKVSERRGTETSIGTRSDNEATAGLNGCDDTILRKDALDLAEPVKKSYSCQQNVDKLYVDTKSANNVTSFFGDKAEPKVWKTDTTFLNLQAYTQDSLATKSTYGEKK